MARLTKKEILGLTPQQIEQMRRTNLQQLKQITSDLQAINRKSYLRSKAAGIDSPFVSAYEKSGGPASLKSFRGSSNEAAQVKAEFESQMSLLKSKTRTFAGAQKVYSEMVKKIDPSHKKFGSNIREMKKEDVSKFWDIYHKLSEKHASIGANGSLGSPPEAVSDIIKSQLDSGDDIDEILSKVDSMYQDYYQEEEQNADYDENPFVFSEDES